MSITVLPRLFLPLSAEMPQFPEEPLNAPPSKGYGYFPAFPGLKLDGGRYEVVHKLGFGPRSSVWLVKDTVQVPCLVWSLIKD